MLCSRLEILEMVQPIDIIHSLFLEMETNADTLSGKFLTADKKQAITFNTESELSNDSSVRKLPMTDESAVMILPDIAATAKT